MEILKQKSTVMNVWLTLDDEAWMCGNSECMEKGKGDPPKMCPGCQLPVMANVVYARSS